MHIADSATGYVGFEVIQPRQNSGAEVNQPCPVIISNGQIFCSYVEAERVFWPLALLPFRYDKYRGCGIANIQGGEEYAQIVESHCAVAPLARPSWSLSAMETVTGRSSALVQQTDLKQDVFHVAANLAGKEGFSTLILDCRGRIRSCGAPAEKIFRASQVRMTGRSVSEFITGLYLGDDSPSYNARYLGYLCAGTEWRRFEAQDVDGVGFTVEVKLSRTVLDGEEVFLLSVHRPEAATCR